MTAYSLFGYYVDLALRSFRRNKMLTALMVLAIAIGIGASMTTLSVFYILSGDPLPQKSGVLFYPRIDPRNNDGFIPGDDPEMQMTRFDAEALLREHRGDRQAMMTAGSVAVVAEKGALKPFEADARYTSADFFAMFAVPFRYGNGWAAKDDVAQARVAVISKALNEKLFGDIDSTGRGIRLEQYEFRIIGVLDQWLPTPRFYDLTSQNFGEVEQVFVPFSTTRALDLSPQGNMSCWGSSNADKEGSTGPNAPCAWLQYWVELDSAAKVTAYRQYLEDYSNQQKRAGRFQRAPNVRLDGLMAWLDIQGVVPADVRLQLWMTFGFLLVCVLNTVGLLLAKFMRRSSEIGVRRALGASRREIFTQCLVEAGVVGLAGGIVGLGLAWLGLWAVRHQPADYAELAHLDPVMLLTTFVLALIASVLAGLLPAWSACQIAPAIQLKSQ